MAVESCVHPSLHSNCHHQIVFAKFNLMISYPPPYSTKVWQLVTSNGKKPSTTLILLRKYLFSIKPILNVLSNYIPHETLTCDDKYPPWFNSQVKSLLQDKNKLYKDCRRSDTNAQLLNKLNHLQEQLNFVINSLKQNHYT